MGQSYEVVVVGGGLAGLAAAYQLARRGAAVLLLEANSLGSGTSGASAGRAQLSESHRGLHLELVLAGLERLEQLEAELGATFEWRRQGNLMLIDQERHWWQWVDQVEYLAGQGLAADMLDQKALQQAEPQLCAGKFLGAAWCLEGHLNPMKYCHAFAGAARRHGATLRPATPVIGFEQANGRITAVKLADERITTGAVLVAAGAWSNRVLNLAGASLPVQFTHAEAIISEPLPPLIHNHVGLADFYETIHNAPQAVSVGVGQQENGTLLVTEAVQMLPEIQRGNSHWGIPAIARALLALFPKLGPVRVVRSWAAPSPFLPDEQPAVGRLPGVDNLFVMTCLHLTITTIPIISELTAGLLLNEPDPARRLAPFDPARF